MKIAVCLKQVFTRETHIRVNAAGTGIRDDAASWALNEADGYALEQALRMRDAHGGELIVVSAGPTRVTRILRDALARGADRAIHVEGDHLSGADAFTTARALAAALAGEQPDVIFTGLQSDDQGFGQVGITLAEYLGAAHATLVVAIEVHGNQLRVKRELEGGWFQWVTMPMPAVLTIQSGLDQLRYASLKGVMAAKKKELRVVAAPPAPHPTQRIVSVRIPERTKQTTVLTGSPGKVAAELVAALRNGRVI